MADEQSLKALRDALGSLPTDTMQVRKGRERAARLKDDGRANRVRQPVEKFSVDLPPGVKASVVMHCRRRGVLIKDFVLECLENGMAGYDSK